MKYDIQNTSGTKGFRSGTVDVIFFTFCLPLFLCRWYLLDATKSCFPYCAAPLQSPCFYTLFLHDTSLYSSANISPSRFMHSNQDTLHLSCQMLDYFPLKILGSAHSFSLCFYVLSHSSLIYVCAVFFITTQP